MNALWNAPISDRFSSLCARVFSPAAAILENEKTLGTRLGHRQIPENNRDASSLLATGQLFCQVILSFLAFEEGFVSNQNTRRKRE